MQLWNLVSREKVAPSADEALKMACSLSTGSLFPVPRGLTPEDFLLPVTVKHTEKHQGPHHSTKPQKYTTEYNC
jgi:hypothetical protein